MHSFDQKEAPRGTYREGNTPSVCCFSDPYFRQGVMCTYHSKYTKKKWDPYVDGIPIWKQKEWLSNRVAVTDLERR